jgi:dephospho-CoA kinase
MILGITGGVATGKSTAAGVLARMGLHIIDCDEIARYLTQYDTATLQAIECFFGGDVFDPGGALDRRALARQVFDSPDKRSSLETLLHPRIAGIVSEGIRWARLTNRDAVVVIPLLFESGWQTQVDHTWVVTCLPEQQVARAASRGWSSEHTARRMAAQMPLKQKEALADSVVDNTGSQEELAALVQRLWEGLRISA